MISEKVKVGLRLNQYIPTSNELFNGACLNHNNKQYILLLFYNISLIHEQVASQSLFIIFIIFLLLNCVLISLSLIDLTNDVYYIRLELKIYYEIIKTSFLLTRCNRQSFDYDI